MAELIFTKEQLEDPKIRHKIFVKAENAFLYDTALTGDELVEITEIRIKLENGLKAYGSMLLPSITRDYQNLLIKLKFFTLYDFGEKEIVKLFKDHFLFVLKDGKVDIEKKLRVKLFQMPYKTRDPFLRDIRKALQESTETLGTKDLKIGPKEAREKPYLKNWLKDYEQTFGTGKHGAMEIADYLYKSPNVRKLTVEERALLKKILEFYEKLKLEVTDPDALSTYSLATFGIKAVGRGFKRRFMPMEHAVPVISPRKIEEKVPPLETFAPTLEVKETRPKILTRIRPIIKPIKARPEEMIVDLREKKRAQFLAAKPIPTDILAKLSTPQGLAQFTIKDFRSLGKDAHASAEFFVSKIKKLAAVSPVDRMACKDNLRKSELYRIYLSQGKESLDTGKSIREVAETRKKEGRPYLTEEEYGTIGGVIKVI